MHMIILAAVMAFCIMAGFGLGWVLEFSPVNQLIAGYASGTGGLLAFIAIMYLLPDGDGQDEHATLHEGE